MVKSAFRKALSLSTNFASQDLLIFLSGQKMIRPFYHTVSDSDLWHIKNLYPIVGVNQFNQDLDFFQKYYSAVDSRYLLAEKSMRGEKTFFLSFDDGLSEFHDVIAPILIKRGIPAVFFC